MESLWKTLTLYCKAWIKHNRSSYWLERGSVFRLLTTNLAVAPESPSPFAYLDIQNFNNLMTFWIWQLLQYLLRSQKIRWEPKRRTLHFFVMLVANPNQGWTGQSMVYLSQVWLCNITLQAIITLGRNWAICYNGLKDKAQKFEISRLNGEHMRYRHTLSSLWKISQFSYTKV